MWKGLFGYSLRWRIFRLSLQDHRELLHLAALAFNLCGLLLLDFIVPLIFLHSLGVLARPVIGHAEPIVSVSLIGICLDRPPIQRNRLVQVVLRYLEIAKLQISVGALVIECHR